MQIIDPERFLTADHLPAHSSFAFADDEKSARGKYGARPIPGSEESAGSSFYLWDFNKAYNPYCAYAA